MEEDDRKRPRAQSQTDRDLESERARRERESAAAFDVPIHDPESPTDLTPVRGILETFENPELQRALAVMWAHSANVEMRAEKRLQETEAGQLRAELDQCRRELDELRGIDGKNGKVGALRSDMDKVLGRAWWLITLMLGSIGVAAAKLLFLGSLFGSMSTHLDNNSARLSLIEGVLFLRSVPGKVSP